MFRRSTFPLSYENNLTCNMGRLVPVLCMETLPGDTFRIETDPLIRFAPMVAPVMTDIDAQFWYFYVPNRILWDNTKEDCWETFITGGPTGTATPEVPYMIFDNVRIGGLMDYLNVCSTSTVSTSDHWENGLWTSALPIRAYNMIYNHWFRDENLQPEISISLKGGRDNITGATLLSKNWEKDYFTSAFTSPQRGPAVNIPLVGDAPVTGTASGDISVSGLTDGSASVVSDSHALMLSNGQQAFYIASGTGTSVDATSIATFPTASNGGINQPEGIVLGSPSGTGLRALSIAHTSSDHPLGRTSGSLNVSATGNANLPISGTADMSNISAVNISDLRKASAIQRWLEKSMLFGSRYVETLKSFFGITPRDSRISIPEYLGGFKMPVLVSEVLQTSQTSASSPQGNMAGHGFAARLGRRIKCFSPEHGWIMCIMSVTPRSSYFQGVPRQYTRKTRYDYFWPQFQGIGEQEILNKEVYYTDDSEKDEGVFGYQQRYAEYKTKSNEIHGDFRSSLDFWNMSRKFENAPKLNGSFVMSDPTFRIWADTAASTDHLWCKINHVVKCSRRMARYSKPSLR